MPKPDIFCNDPAIGIVRWRTGDFVRDLGTFAIGLLYSKIYTTAIDTKYLKPMIFLRKLRFRQHITNAMLYQLS
ncbi:MAG: hypothetical protein B7Y10_10725 [Sphingomonadales bacterium 24-56-14]|nr:MAG: hypothetical protein B7Y10_10725 [Sphingomonadales bacterium 24-56-14]